MARVRLLHPQQTTDEDVNDLSIQARYVWAFLPCHADREGRLADKPFALKLAILPIDAVDMNAILSELASKRFITRYQHEGRKYIQIRNFDRYQRPHRNEAASAVPAPDGCPSEDHGSPKATQGPTLVVQGQTMDRTCRADPDPDPVTDPDTDIRIRRDPCGTEHRAPAPPTPPAPTISQGPPLSPPVPDRMNGYTLQRFFGEIRSEILGGLAWAVPPDTTGKATTFAEEIERLGPEAIADVKPTMRRLLEHIRDVDEGWEDERYRKNTAFAFGSWISRFSDLREELHSKRPALKRASLASGPKLTRYDPKVLPPK